ncbi:MULTISPECIES: hypothetical protein [Terrabacteria group]|uniref:hypothetical protein n=1 Tax=Bacillati TaxID=1783272 RepID=UPI0019396FE2|nr:MULTISPECIES: hypothetical protein [Terrabacteria group]MBW9212747.1 hypothetical protein [Trueperella sp. zg.1013]QRG86576.1 hypothetical protein JOS54_06980 [Bulleidia sp. zg-1006]
MSVNQMIFLVLDVLVFAMFTLMLVHSSQVEVETKVGNRWAVFVLFVLLAIVGFMHNQGAFRYIQSGVVLGLGIMYMNMKSGLSPKGVVLMGSLVKYKKIGQLTLSRKDSSLFFEHFHKINALFFEPSQYEEFRDYLAKYSVSVKKMPH